MAQQFIGRSVLARISSASMPRRCNSSTAMSRRMSCVRPRFPETPPTRACHGAWGTQLVVRHFGEYTAVGGIRVDSHTSNLGHHFDIRPLSRGVLDQATETGPRPGNGSPELGRGVKFKLGHPEDWGRGRRSQPQRRRWCKGSELTVP